MILEALRDRSRAGNPIRVAVVGAGSMGTGIARRVAATPGLELAAVSDLDVEKAARAAARGRRVLRESPGPENAAGVFVSKEIAPVLEGNPLGLDVLVEATNTVEFAAGAVATALRNRIHVVLMNAEVDLLLGPWLHDLARRCGVGITSDAGDQHGVLMRMIEEVELWGLDVVMAGNIKGFLDRRATAASIAEEARIRALNPVQCVAYTDGTKLNVEMALVANATGLVPYARGMEGPSAARVQEVFERFDFDRYEAGVVDYLLGAEPGGGVFVVGRCDEPLQQDYLAYYKMGKGPYYLFYRPFHLCHLETPYAIAMLVLYGRKILEPVHGKLAEVGAFAKRDLNPGTRISRGIGSDDLYGLIDLTATLDREGCLPIALLDTDSGAEAIVRREIPRDRPITRDDVELPDSPLRALFEEQQSLASPPRPA